MLKKLYKHEFIGLYRILIPLYGLLFGLSAAVRILSMFKTDNKILNYVNNITVILTTVMAIGLMFASFVLVIVNFYKSLLGKQGYLTFSLPFKAHTHIICKAVCGVITSITTILAEFIALIIIFGGYDFFKEIHLFIKSIFNAANDYMGVGKTVIVSFEIVICMVTVLFANILMFFAAMAFGQQFKNRILGAVLSYFGIYIAVETVLSVGMTAFSGILAMVEIESLFAAFQFYLSIIFVVAALQTVGYFFLSNYFLSKKLNLE